MAGTLIVSTIEAQNYKYDSDTTAITVDTTGRILTPARPSILVDFHSGSAAGYEEVGNGSTLPFRNKVQGVGITQDVSEYAIIIPISGLYQVNMQVLAEDAGEGIELAMTVGGVASSNIILRNYTHETRSCAIHAAWEFTANDVVRVFNNTGASRGFYRHLLPGDTGRYSYWSTYLIG